MFSFKKNYSFISKAIAIVVSLFLQFKSTYAQKRNASPLNTSEKSITFLNDSMSREDSSITNFEIYKPLLLAQDLGNLTSPYRFLYWQNPNDIGFKSGWFKADQYFFTPQSARYYKATLPFTLASYVSGQRPGNYLDYLQQVKLYHTQNWGPLFNIGVKINNNRCNGFSTNAEARASSSQIFSWFHSANYRYQIFANTNFNSSSNKLNGGIVNDSNYENSSGVTREIEGLLKDSSLFRYKAQIYHVKQIYRMGDEKQHYVTRKIKRDSTTIDTLREIDTRLQLGHCLQFSREAWVYQDNISKDESFFKHYFFDTLRTKDTLHQNTLSNLIDATLPSKKNTLWYISLENRLHWLYQLKSKVNVMNENFVHGQVQKMFIIDSNKTVQLKQNISYCLFNNFNEFSGGDYIVDGGATMLAPPYSFKLGYSVSANAPTLLQTYYTGNHFYWYTSTLQKTKISSIIIEAKDAKEHTFIKISYSQINNYTYFDSMVTPRQAEALSYFAAHWKQNFNYKSIHYSHQAVWQHSSNSKAMALPQVVLKATLFYDDEWFKKALHVQLGTSVNYFSKYFAPLFMPSVNIFYIQDKKEIGNYPQFDAFVNIQIQRIRIFIISEHVNQGMAGFSNASYITPHYPIANKAIRFGVCWTFYN